MTDAFVFNEDLEKGTNVTLTFTPGSVACTNCYTDLGITTIEGTFVELRAENTCVVIELNKHIVCPTCDSSLSTMVLLNELAEQVMRESLTFPGY